MEAKVTAAGTEWRARKACFCRAGCSSLRSRALGEALTQHCVGHFAQRMLPIQRGVPDVELHMPGRNVRSGAYRPCPRAQAIGRGSVKTLEDCVLFESRTLRSRQDQRSRRREWFEHPRKHRLHAFPHSLGRFRKSTHDSVERTFYLRPPLPTTPAHKPKTAQSTDSPNQCASKPQSPSSHRHCAKP